MAENILIVHLVSNGDCLMATTLARQIKSDYPECQLTWAVSFKCKQVLLNNPYIDEIWEINYSDQDSPIENVWNNLKEEIKTRNYSQVHYTQIFPDNELFYDGTTRSTTFNVYPNKITVPVQPIIRLFENEIDAVKKFVSKFQLDKYEHKIIFECTPSSGQSEMNLEIAISISEILTRKIESLIVVISTHVNFESPNDRIVNGSELSFRENAELSNYCSFLIGCSSGISWLLTSDWSKKLPTLQILNGEAYGFSFASISYDFKYWNLNTDHIIETDIIDTNEISELVLDALVNFENAKKYHHKIFKPNYNYVLDQMVNYLVLKEYAKIFIQYKKFSLRNNKWVELFYRFIVKLFKILTRKK
ncbi:MAG: hypothetical protein COB15_00430 [Flavobacteriales bacterium]|nr:MAG: hypothetical protein COB15_00430 [Flavobacteriales bacterium]